MKLTTRVSVYFLATLAIALVIYSLAFYLVTRRQIEYQFEHELRGILNSLVAAAEIEETEVKWQPLEHLVSFGTLDELGPIDWIVVGDRKQVVEQSHEAHSGIAAIAMQLAIADSPSGSVLNQTQTSDQHVVLYQRVAAPRPLALERELDEFDELMVVVGRSTAKRNAILRRLAFLVTCLPLAAWLVAAVIGRWMVRQALRPVSEMVQQTQAIAGSDFQSRLIVQESGDEITELGTTFNRLLDRQQAAFEQQRRFAGDAAHELRSPITALLGQIDVTLRRPRSASEYVATLERLRTEAASFREIVETLLFLARREDDAIPLSLQPIAVAEWLNDYAQAWHRLPRATDFQVTNKIADSITVRATSALLARILENLVSNALKYSAVGSPIKIAATSDQKQVLIRVTDAGCGISAADQEHLFDPFFRSREARIRGIAGNGLGLAIASRVAGILGGELQVESTLGQGSCFTLWLPIFSDSL